MPFEKVATMPSGAVGEYHVINRHTWDPVARVFSCSFDLYVDAATFGTDPETPLVYDFAKFRSTGTDFDTCFAPAALANRASVEAEDIVTWAYICVQLVCDDYVTNLNVIDPEAYLVCDLGHDFYDDATIV